MYFYTCLITEIHICTRMCVTFVRAIQISWQKNYLRIVIMYFTVYARWGNNKCLCLSQIHKHWLWFQDQPIDLRGQCEGPTDSMQEKWLSTLEYTSPSPSDMQGHDKNGTEAVNDEQVVSTFSVLWVGRTGVEYLFSTLGGTNRCWVPFQYYRDPWKSHCTAIFNYTHCTSIFNYTHCTAIFNYTHCTSILNNTHCTVIFN